MPQPIDNQLIFDVLKKVQSDVASTKADVAEVKAMQLRLREDPNPLRGRSLALRAD